MPIDGNGCDIRQQEGREGGGWVSGPLERERGEFHSSAWLELLELLEMWSRGQSASPSSRLYRFRGFPRAHYRTKPLVFMVFLRGVK